MILGEVRWWWGEGGSYVGIPGYPGFKELIFGYFN